MEMTQELRANVAHGKLETESMVDHWSKDIEKLQWDNDSILSIQTDNSNTKEIDLT